MYKHWWEFIYVMHLQTVKGSDLHKIIDLPTQRDILCARALLLNMCVHKNLHYAHRTLTFISSLYFICAFWMFKIHIPNYSLENGTWRLAFSAGLQRIKEWPSQSHPALLSPYKGPWMLGSSPQSLPLWVVLSQGTAWGVSWSRLTWCHFSA